MESEEESITLLQSMMGNDLDREVARRVLIKHSHDLQAAASAILEGDRGEANAWVQNDTIDLTDSGALNATRRPNTPLAPTKSEQQIDAGLSNFGGGAGNTTGRANDEYESDLDKALRMSLEQTNDHNQANAGSSLRPSDRAPDPNWAVVPSNVSLLIKCHSGTICSAFSWVQTRYLRLQLKNMTTSL